MIRRPWVVFSLVISFLIAGVLWFIQSAHFAVVLKTVASQYLPKDLGISGDFSEISVQLFPPGFSLRKPRLSVKGRNPVQLPIGSSVVAERIDFSFRPFQIFSGAIRIHEVAVINGRIELNLEAPAPHKKAEPMHWEDLFRVRAEGVALENVEFNVHLLQGGSAVAQQTGVDPSLQGNARRVRLRRAEDQAGLGYLLELDLSQLNGSVMQALSLPGSVDSVKARARVNESGMQIESLSLGRAGLEVAVAGALVGNFLNLEKSLKADLTVKAKGDLSVISKTLNLNKRGPLLGGQFNVEGKLTGNLFKAVETLRVEGSVQVENMIYEQWKAQSVQAQGQWESSSQGGQFTLKRALINSPLSPRIGGTHPGEGGRVELGATRWSFGSSNPVEVPVRFDHVHLHWLAGPALRAVYPLDFRVNGETHFTYRPGAKGRSWELQAVLSNWLEEFQLDNQRYQKTQPLSVVFKIPKISLSGPVILDATGLRPNHLAIGLPHSILSTTGKVDVKTGYNLKAVGNLDLADFGQVGPNEIRGQGPVTVHVHGLPVAVLVDIDVDIQNGYYLKLALGSVHGRITWDDEKNKIIFEKARLKYHETPYSVDGWVDVGANDRVDLAVQIPSGDIQDFIQIFGHLTQELSWFPHSLSGPFSGQLKVQGGLDFSKLSILGNIAGRDWGFFGEKFKDVELTGGYDRGKYVIRPFRIVKRFTPIVGEIAVDERQELTWKVQTQGFTISEFDHIAELDVPFRSEMTFMSEGHGKGDQVESATTWGLNNFSVRGLKMPSSQATIKTSQGKAYWVGSYLGGQASVDAIYDTNPQAVSSIKAELNQFDFSPVLLLLNTKLMQDPALLGLVSGGLDLKFHAGAAEKASGRLHVTDYLLGSSAERIQLDHPAEVSISEGAFDLRNWEVQGKSGKIGLDLKNNQDMLQGHITGNLDHSLVQFFVPSISQFSGFSRLDFTVGGSLKQPLIEGEAQLNGGQMKVLGLESPFDHFSGTIQVKQNKVTAHNLKADLGGGSLSLNGEIVLASQQSPSMDLKVALQNTKVKCEPFQFAKVSGLLGIHGNSLPYLIDGNLVIDSALYNEKILNQKRRGETFKANQYLPLPTKLGANKVSLFNLKVEVDAHKGIQVQNDLFRDMIARGQLTLVNTLETPRVLGRLEVSQGMLLFKDHNFKIQSASALFDNPNIINPSFDLVATTEANSTKIQMYASGKKEDLKIEMTSSPSLPESDIFSLLALGFTSADAKRLSASDLSLIQQGEAASLVLHSLDFNRDLEERTGFQLLVDESVNKQQGVSAFRPQNTADASAAPQITIKRKLSDRLSVSAGSTMGFGSSKSNQINLDYSVGSGLLVNGVFNNYGSNTSSGSGGAYGATDTQATQTSVGLDLKFIRRFK